MKVSNLLKALKGQLPLSRAFRNFFITGNAWGMFSKHSHYKFKENEGYTGKVMYNTKATADKSAIKMGEKIGKHFSSYKCVFCDGYHIGKNRDNK